MKKLLIFTIITLLFITNSCKKYEDGPLISFRTAKKKLTGKWKFEYFEINGIDSTEYFLNKFNNYISFGIYKDHEIKKMTMIVASLEIDYEYFGNSVYGEWDFFNDNKSITIKFLNSDTDVIPYIIYYDIKGIGPFGTDKISKWEIKRLTKNELWMETEFENKDYYIKLINTY